MKIKCLRIDCLHNSKLEKIFGFCQRKDILIDKQSVAGQGIILWVCRCFSNEGFSGHMDWSRYPQGGHLSDLEVNNIYKDSLKSKSYKTHLKQGKEPKRK